MRFPGYGRDSLGMLDYGAPNQAHIEEQKKVLAHAFAVAPADLGTSLQWAGHENRIAVTDLQASTPRAYRRLWSFLRDISRVVSEIVFFTAPADPAYLVHPNPQFGMRLVDNWMVRVVDARAALTARGYASHVDAELHLELRDELVPHNAGRWVLCVREGTATLDRGGQGHLQLDARALAALYTGFASPHDLVLLDRITADPRTLATASTIFAGPMPWMPDMF
jgi:predicted acetyltransferase